MSTATTVSDLAELIGAPIDNLLNQLNDAGIKALKADSIISDKEKLQLLEYIRSGQTLEQIKVYNLDINTVGGRKDLKRYVVYKLKKCSYKEAIAVANKMALSVAWYLEDLIDNSSQKLDSYHYEWVRSLMSSLCINYIHTKKSKEAALAASYRRTISFKGKEGNQFSHIDSKNSVIDYAYTATASAAEAASFNFTFQNTENIIKSTAQCIVATFWLALQCTRDISYLSDRLNVILESTSLKELSLDTYIFKQDNEKILQPPRVKGIHTFWSTFIFQPALDEKLGQTKQNLLFFEGFLAVPEEVHKEKSVRAMQVFIEDYIAHKGQQKTTQSARLILLGNGGSGKTSIVKKLFKESLPSYEKQTPRIQVRDYQIKGLLNNINLSIWDFGGQVIMHSTHSFFISSRSTYIITCNTRANEQPDNWLELLQTRVHDIASKITLLIVYTHCDSLYFDTKEKMPWRRDNALKRGFGKQFNLLFFNIDLNPNNKILGFEDLEKEIIKRAEQEGATPMFPGVSEVKKYSEKLENKSQPFIQHNDLINAINGSNDYERLFRVANSYGYIFPECPLDAEDSIADDFIWVSQKHWLTYGVYSLINNTKVIDNYGVLTQDIMEDALVVNKYQRIEVNGEVVRGKPKAKQEGLFYNSEGIHLLKRILLSYRWAMMLPNRQKDLLLPLATSLDEPTELTPLSLDFKHTLETDPSNVIFMTIELVNKPRDFFFKLAIYFDPHLSKTQYLWRTGAILEFYGNNETRAIIEIPDNILSLKIFGRERESFQQLLLINIKETLKTYEGISAHSSEYIALGKDQFGEKQYMMLSSDVINSLTNESDMINIIKDQLMKRATHMTTININGSATGNIGGAGNSFINQDGGINNYFDMFGKELIDELKNSLDKLSETDSKVINEAVTEIETVINTTSEEKKEKLVDMIVKTGKVASAIDKLVEIGGEYADKANDLYEKFIVNYTS